MFNKKKQENQTEENPFALNKEEFQTENAAENNNTDNVSEEKKNENAGTGNVSPEKNNEENSDTDKTDKTDKSNEELEQLKNQYIRLAADFDNFRKRQAQERENLLKYGAESTLKLILPVLDTYERGKKACEETDDATQIKDNYEVIFKQLFTALEKAGLKKIETEGKEFDPNLHEAVMQTQTSEQPENSIVAELQAGYMLGDRVLRAAMVNVAVGE